MLAAFLLPSDDILTFGFCGLQAFQLALEAANAKAATTAFFDDSARNVAAGHAAGLFSVLVRAAACCHLSLHTCLRLQVFHAAHHCWLSDHYSM